MFQDILFTLGNNVALEQIALLLFVLDFQVLSLRQESYRPEVLHILQAYV